MFRDERHSLSSPNKPLLRGQNMGKKYCNQGGKSNSNTDGWVTQHYTQPISLWLIISTREDEKTNISLTSSFVARSNHVTKLLQIGNNWNSNWCFGKASIFFWWWENAQLYTLSVFECGYEVWCFSDPFKYEGKAKRISKVLALMLLIH